MNEQKCPICSSGLKQSGTDSFDCAFCGTHYTKKTEGGKVFLVDNTGTRYPWGQGRQQAASPVPGSQLEKTEKNAGKIVLVITVFLLIGIALGGVGYLLFSALSMPRRVPASKPPETAAPETVAGQNPATSEAEEEERYATAEMSEDMASILNIIFGRPVHELGWEDVDKILYFESSASIISNVRIVRYSFEDYFAYEDKMEFEKTIQTVELPYDIMDSSFTTSDLQYMQMLTYLDCRNSRPDAEDLERHGQLKGLKIYGKSLDEIAELVQADRLLELYAEGDEITDLSALNRFSALQKLELGDTGITSLDGLERCPDLTALSLIDNELVQDYRLLSNFTELMELNLECELKDIDFLAELPNLKKLSLIDTELLRLDALVHCAGLTELYLEDNYELKDQLAVAQLTGLQALTIDDVSSLEILRPLTNLLRLTMENVYATEDLSVLAGLSQLEYLELHGLGNGVKSFAPLTLLPALKDLNLSDGSFYFNTTDLFSIPSLERLNLSGSTFGSDFSQIANMSQLKYLNLDNIRVTVNNQVQSSGYYTEVYYDEVELNEVVGALGALPNLEELRLKGNELETVEFAAALTNLTYLDISENYIKDLSPLSGLENLAVVAAFDNPLLPESVPEGLTVIQ